MRINQMVRDAKEMILARIENGYPISAVETPEMIAREMIEQSDPWPGAPFQRCARAVKAALIIVRQDQERGRPLTDAEKVENIRQFLAEEN